MEIFGKFILNSDSNQSRTYIEYFKKGYLLFFGGGNSNYLISGDFNFNFKG